eukprot:m.1336050 g.1336050  ORF g.1336050 m.1336050 type:complete len:1309 (-) comp24879_c1_seq55:998-4924(-)
MLVYADVAPTPAGATRASPSECDAAMVDGIALLIVDEAHHIYAPTVAPDNAFRMALAKAVARSTKVAYCTDMSQAADGAQLVFPAGAQTLQLTEVVRNSRRVVEASTAFLGGGCTVDAYSDQLGPPLIPYMFSVRKTPEERRAAYGTYVWMALHHLRRDFVGLPVHGNTAILVPDVEWAKWLCADLRRRDSVAGGGADEYEFVDAVQGARLLPRSPKRDGSIPPAEKNHRSQIVVDAIDAFDGMEKLIVFAVDLDDVSSLTSYASSARIYRAITRAHMFVVVIQEHVKSGWLEYLGAVKWTEDASTAEQREQDTPGATALRPNAVVSTTSLAMGTSDTTGGAQEKFPADQDDITTDVAPIAVMDDPAPPQPANSAWVSQVGKTGEAGEADADREADEAVVAGTASSAVRKADTLDVAHRHITEVQQVAAQQRRDWLARKQDTRGSLIEVEEPVEISQSVWIDNRGDDMRRDLGQDMFNPYGSNNTLAPEVAEFLAKFSLDVNAVEWNLSSREIGTSGALLLAAAVGGARTLAVLRVSDNAVGDGGAAALLDALLCQRPASRAMLELYLSGNGIGAAGAKKLAELLAIDNTLTTLNMGDNTVSDAGCVEIGLSLKVNTCLAILHLEKNHIGAQGAQALAEALKVNGCLQALHLAHNAIGDEGASALGDSLRVNTTLQILDIAENGLDAAGSTAVCSALQQHPALHTLALSGNTLGAGGGTAVGALLRHNAVLRKVQLSRADLGDAGAVGVAEGLAANRMLRVLYLRENGVGDTGAAALANALRSNMKIEWLHLKHNVITDDGGMAFVGAYTSTAGLVAVVDLDFNACSQDVYHRVVEARKHNRSLIEDSEFGGDRGPSGADASLPLEQSSAPRSPFMDRATIIAALSERAVEFDPAETTEALRALHAVHVAERGMVDPQTRMRGATALNDDEQVFANAHSWQQDLIEWDVSDRGITDTECTVLCNLVARSITTVVYLQSNSLTDAACADLARMLSTNRSLEKLFLNQNRITERGARDIAAALGSNTALQELYLHDNAIDDAGMMNLARALARNSTLTALSLDGNPGGAAAAQAVVSMLETNRGLRQLNVSRIHLGDTGGEAIAAALENKNSTVLEALYCSDCGIGADAMRRIDAVLHRNARYRQHWHSVERVVWEIHTDGCARSKGMSMGVVGWCCIHECMVCEADRAMCLPAVQHQGRARLHASARSASGRGQRCVAPQRPRCGRACVRGAGVGTARARCHLHPVPAEQRRRRCGAANTVLRAAPSSAHHMALPGQQRHRRRRRDTSRGVSRREPHHLACVPRTQPHR